MIPELRDVASTGQFESRWPTATESFGCGWSGTVVADGRVRRFRHGIGERFVYRKQRVHAVTWLDGQPVVEGVAADDYDRSRALLSRIKRPDGKLSRSLAEVPSGHEGFLIVTHSDEINAPYSPRGLAVKLREDDLKAWVHLALVRARDRKRTPGHPKTKMSGSNFSAQRQHPRGSPARRAGASIGLTALHELEDTIDPDRFAKYLRLYERETGYDRSLGALLAATHGAPDPLAADHRDRILDWLRHWGCRHLALKNNKLSCEAMGDWAKEWLSKLPACDEHLTDLPEPALTVSAQAFGDLAARPAAWRKRTSGPVAVTFGPTAAAKALHAVRPNAFPPWDAPIREALGLGKDDVAFRHYLGLVARCLRRLSERVGVPVQGLPAALGRPRSSPPKLVDEYLWIRITRGLVVP